MRDAKTEILTWTVDSKYGSKGRVILGRLGGAWTATKKTCAITYLRGCTLPPSGNVFPQRLPVTDNHFRLESKKPQDYKGIPRLISNPLFHQLKIKSKICTKWKLEILFIGLWRKL
jgi:hypothetical protein